MMRYFPTAVERAMMTQEELIKDVAGVKFECLGADCSPA
jgi:hypothetical protein